jgi:hypothetical protein
MVTDLKQFGRKSSSVSVEFSWYMPGKPEGKL